MLTNKLHHMYSKYLDYINYVFIKLTDQCLLDETSSALVPSALQSIQTEILNFKRYFRMHLSFPDSVLLVIKVKL